MYSNDATAFQIKHANLFIEVPKGTQVSSDDSTHSSVSRVARNTLHA